MMGSFYSNKFEVKLLNFYQRFIFYSNFKINKSLENQVF